MYSEELEKYVKSLESEVEKIDSDRKALLDKFAQYISDQLLANKEIALTFICTHNSRRSHLSQIWAQITAYYFGLHGVACFSGGTEETAFFPAAVKAVEKAGVKVIKLSNEANPVYAIKYGLKAQPLSCFSKKYNAAFNPESDYTAVMTCSNADQNCPFIPEASSRFVIKYEDPKIADNTPDQEKIYDERCRQIAREMFYAFSQVKG